jgi:hypothetical protein
MIKLPNPNIHELPAAKPEDMKYDYSKAVHVIGETFQINVEPNGTVKIAFAAVGMNPTDAQVQAVAHITPGLMEPLINAMGLIANRMGIKIHNSVQ